MRGSATVPDLSADRARACELAPVSRETLQRLDRLVDTLLVWQKRTNLIAASTVPHLWTRHIADSLQLLALAPHARVWVDLGSGGGFPGLVIACALAAQKDCVVHLVEANQKKCSFLREAVRATGAPALVHAMRIEDFVGSFRDRADVITARALAPLDILLYHVHPMLQPGTIAILPKGQDVGDELDKASKSWIIEGALVPSKTNPKGRIVVVRELRPRELGA